MKRSILFMHMLLVAMLPFASLEIVNDLRTESVK